MAETLMNGTNPISCVSIPIEVKKRYTIESTDWVANTYAATSADYPFIAVISSSDYSGSSKPFWQMGGSGDIPTATERMEGGYVAEAWFDTNGVTLYATTKPLHDLVMEVKGD